MEASSYSDGNGNTWQIEGLKVTYHPVTTIESSSGIYDGGDPLSIEISEEDLTRLLEMFDAGFRNRTFRLEKRALGSGQISKTIDGEQKVTVILAMRSPDKLNIEAFFDALKP